MLKLAADQLKVGGKGWDQCVQREQTRCEHRGEQQKVSGYQPFTIELLPEGRADAGRAGQYAVPAFLRRALG